jgi:isovaleryl-CoA dehydrogenase
MLSRIARPLVSKSVFRRTFSTPVVTATQNIFSPTEEHQALREMLRGFVESEIDPQALEYNKKEEFNVDLFRKLGDLGLLGITVPVEYGGSGMDATAAVIAHEEMASSDPAFCLSYLAHSMLFVNNLCQNGNEEQKHRFLPGTCSGELIGGMGMSEPAAGTDVMGMATTATPNADGTEYTINGAKMWITNGTVDGHSDTGDVFLVYAKTGSGRGKNDVTSFLIEKGMPGFTLGQKIHDKVSTSINTSTNTSKK